jgi:hypothetical protein
MNRHLDSRSRERKNPADDYGNTVQIFTSSALTNTLPSRNIRWDLWLSYGWRRRGAPDDHKK